MLRQMYQPAARVTMEPKRVTSQESSTDDETPVGTKFAQLPKMLNYHNSELTYYSTQSQTSSEVSSGISSCRSSLPAKLSSKGFSRLFKGVSLCPPIAPKTIFSPNLES